LKGKVVYDVGAFQGIMTLFFAQKARAVISYEPHPSNCRRFGENVALNRLNHVTVLNRAVGNKESTLRLVCDPRMPGAASGDAGISAQISGSVAQASTMEVPMVRLDDDIERNHLPLPDFIKIDIEGMELAALEGMTETLSKHRPALYLEMHGVSEEEKEEKAARIVRFLHSMGYTHIRHVETGTVINASNVAVARAGHLYCTTVP
jgi:FkbM family methyltransferase